VPLRALATIPRLRPPNGAQLGGKGANLAEMSRIGLSVPPGLTITTNTCAEFHSNGRSVQGHRQGQGTQE
jgi:phosphoenolpyruvate synthase/pyruvate phosphate dikinase